MDFFAQLEGTLFDHDQTRTLLASRDVFAEETHRSWNTITSFAF